MTAGGEGRYRLKARPNYGLDSPRIILSLLLAGVAVGCAAYALHSFWRWIALVVDGYFLLGALGLLFYSKVGKLKLRQRLLDRLAWSGDERVLDVGCGCGLLAIAAAHRVPGGSVVGIDVWDHSALTGNRPETVLQNAQIEGVGDRVDVQHGDARQIPFPDGSFDVVLSNFVVHELRTRQDRERMMRELARVLKPGGRVGLVDFIFTDQCVEDLRNFGVAAKRMRDGFLSFWISAILNLGAVQTYHVIGTKSGGDGGN